VPSAWSSGRKFKNLSNSFTQKSADDGRRAAHRQETLECCDSVGEVEHQLDRTFSAFRACKQQDTETYLLKYCLNKNNRKELS
jgi:hypothetical protein